MFYKRLAVIAVISVLFVLSACSGKSNIITSEADPSNAVVFDQETLEEVETVVEESTKEAVLTGWEDLSFVLMGEQYAVPFSAETLIEGGWTISETTDEYSLDYMLEPAAKVSNVYDISKDGYNEAVRLSVGFINNTDTAKNIKECNVWSFVCNIYDEENDCIYENAPELKLAKDITWGAGLSDIEAAFGEPMNKMESQEGADDFSVYTYLYNGVYIMKLTAWEDCGLAEVVLLAYDE